jgi:outer membrane protein W
MKRGLMVLSVLSVLVGGVATASVQKGDTELDALGGFLFENGTNEAPDFDVYFLSGSFGYFLTDNIRVGAEAAWSHVGIDLGTTTPIGTSFDVDVWAIGGNVKYHFMPTNQWVPYIGVQVLYASADLDIFGNTDGVLWGPVAGLRYELNANNDFFVEYQYQLWSGDIGDFLNDGNAIFLGIAHQFK